MPKKAKPSEENEELQGWPKIAQFLGQPLSVAQRWARSGMSVQRKGRYVVATRAELNRWLGKESGGEPVEITNNQTDLAAELKRGLSYVRKHRSKA